MLVKKKFKNNLKNRVLYFAVSLFRFIFVKGVDINAFFLTNKFIYYEQFKF